MRKLRIVYMGTPDFAVPCLEKLVEDGHQVQAVVTQPDRPKGRGQKLAYSPVKIAALAHNLPVLQPAKIKEPAFIEQMTALAPDVIIVVAFGQFLPKQMLALPPLGCINVHASILPYYRGAAPIHWAVINGEALTGVTTMYMDAGMDTGDMILKAETPIGPDETTGQIHDRLKDLGAQVLSDTLKLLAEQQAPRTPQEHAAATYASLLKREHEKISWCQSAVSIHNLVRGLNPWPGAYCLHNDNILKVWKTQIGNTTEAELMPGRIEAITPDAIVVQTGIENILLLEVQPANKRRMTGGEYARGYGLKPGDVIS